MVRLSAAVMSEKHRSLPSWMSKKAEKVKESEPLKSRRKPKTARSVFYCMNEKELVNAAVSYLTNGEGVALLGEQKVEHKDEAKTVTRKKNPATEKLTSKPATEILDEKSSDISDEHDLTYVSETDLDITEVETVPYVSSSRQPQSKGQRSGAVQDHSPVMADAETEEKDEQLQIQANAAEDDDSFRLVREIFFT